VLKFWIGKLLDAGLIKKVILFCEDIKGVYESGEKLEFNVTSTMDCYLNIFNVTDDETYSCILMNGKILKKSLKGRM